MELWNSTLGSGFILIGVLDDSGSPELLCATINALYMLALTSNGLCFWSSQWMPSFMCPCTSSLDSSLSLMDLLLTSVIIPKAVIDFLLRNNIISFWGYALQVFLELGSAEDLLLAFMAFDRYVVICQPLNYTILMSHKVCWLLIATSWILASLMALIFTTYTIQYPFCKSQQIRHLFCEIPPLLKVACADTSTYELMVYLTGVSMLILPLAVILASYVQIFYSVLHMPSNEGRKKAFVTCSSHLTVVGMWYGGASFMYVLPSQFHNPKQDNVLSIFYTIVTPALNPLIYSLRNKEVSGALRRISGKRLLPTQSNF